MTALEPTLTQRWSRWRKTVAVCAVLLAGALLIALAQSQQNRGYLNPDGVDGSGSRALVRILQAQGVDVTATRTIGAVESASSAGDTVLVTVPDLLVAEQIDRLQATGADLVLVAPDTTAGDFAAGVSVEGEVAPEVVDPGCALGAAELAGSARMGGRTYDAPESTGCYVVGDAPSLVVTTSGGVTVTILGTGDPLTNRYLDQDGNAALAMNVLGAGDGLVWYRPSIEAGVGGDASFIEVMPDWVTPVAWQLVIAAALAAVWRARRFGPLVREPLPVVVHAAEVTEGRATLYRHGRARGHAARSLRDATTSRLRSRLGLPVGASAEDVATAVAVQSGRPADQVAELLDGDDPVDDEQLVQLANDLADLEEQT